MNSYEESAIARASAHNALPHGNPLPRFGEKAPVIKVKPMKIRALSPSFYIADRVAETGEVYTIDANEGRGLIVRGLAERV